MNGKAASIYIYIYMHMTCEMQWDHERECNREMKGSTARDGDSGRQKETEIEGKKDRKATKGGKSNEKGKG